ncbi:MAG: leucyl aminopeptidase [Steroidobacteraceae bacterium]|jgi:leucyl aminopeptidase|nr:leucyl aminopeptidase [Steroidobacteraceae bacterium]
MEFYAESRALARVRTDCAVVGVHEGGELGPAAANLDATLGGRVARIVRGGDFACRLGETLLLPDLGRSIGRVLLVGLGARKGWNRRSYRRALNAAAGALLKCGAKDALFLLGSEAVPEVDAYYRARFVAEAIGNATYRIPDLKTGKKPPAPKLARVGVATERAGAAHVSRGLEHGQAVAAGTAVTRDLGNLPANVCTPTYLGNYAKKLAREHRGLRVQVLGEPQIRRLGMGSFLSVTAGSEQPPRLIVIEYRGAGAGTAPVVLVGKGITFDTGGISIKPAAGMDEMKWDMGGAASVFGTLAALATLGAEVNAVGIVPACENMLSGRATKPGDVVKSMSGQTIEVLNTDAEGRLILCDAITYARRYKPAALVDIATLTGACVVALGPTCTGLWSNDDVLADALVAAGQRTGDVCWRMPLLEEYQEPLKSNFADFANVGGREGGACVAAGFLWKFTDGLRWAHLDIAGTAWLGGANKGSSGRPVPLLFDFLMRRA